MLEGVSLTGWQDYGIVGLFVLAIGFGLLVPRWIHVQRVRDKEEQITYLREIVAKREEQLTTVISNNELVIKLLEDIKRAAQTQQGR